MTAALFTLVLLGLVVYALQRNHTRHPMPVTRLNGSVPFDDRDVDRVAADAKALTAVEDDRPQRTERLQYSGLRSSASV